MGRCTCASPERVSRRFRLCCFTCRGGLVLDGELPMAEFIRAKDGPGVAVLLRAGFYMDRSPGCPHGLDPRRTSRSRFTILEWRDGAGTYLMEEAAATESVVEAAPAEIRELAPDPRPRGS